MTQVNTMRIPMYDRQGTYERTKVDVGPGHRATLIEGEVVSLCSCFGTATDERGLIELEIGVVEEGQGCSFCGELLDTVNKLVR